VLLSEVLTGLPRRKPASGDFEQPEVEVLRGQSIDRESTDERTNGAPPQVASAGGAPGAPGQEGSGADVAARVTQPEPPAGGPPPAPPAN